MTSAGSTLTNAKAKAAAPAAPGRAARLDVEAIRRDFPILRQRVHGRPLVYLDNAATSQKPQAVIDAVTRYYLAENSNVHRGVHFLSEQATQAYEGVRGIVREFLNAAEDREILFVRGTTEGINLVAQSYGRTALRAGDEIVISGMEHHSNIVPWQMLCEATGAVLRVIPITDAGEVELEAYEKLLNARTRLVAVVHISNVLGTINPVKQMIAMARRWNARVLVDGAQAAPHLPVDVRDLDCDFYAFSGHKLLGPTGIGILYGRAELLEGMPPYQGGGDMISAVTFEKTRYNTIPYKFEAGTPHIEGATGSAPPSTTCRGSGWNGSPPTRTSCWPTAPRRCRPSRGCASSARPRPRPPSSPSCWATPTPTTWGRSWTARGWPSGPGTIAPCP
jgi:cysteine desulfurase/selenocysteine lyase